MPLTNLQANVGANCNFSLAAASNGTFNDSKWTQNLSAALNFTFGTASAGQANLLYAAERTLALSTSEEIDLHTSLLDYAGGAINFARVFALMVLHPSTSLSDNIRVGTAAAANTWVGFFADATDGINIPKGGAFLIGVNDNTGKVVTNGATDKLKIANTDAVNAATYRILLIGRSS